MRKKHPWDVLTGGALDSARIAESALKTMQAANVGLGEALTRSSGLRELSRMNAAETFSRSMGVGAAATLGDAFAQKVAFEAGLNEHLIGGWRAALAGLDQPDLTGVSADIARHVSRYTVASASSPLSAFMEAEGKRLAEMKTAVDTRQRRRIKQLEDTLAAFSAERLSVLENFLRPAARFAADRLAERLRELDEEERQSGEALRRMGWWFPWSLPTDVVLDILRDAKRGRRLDVRKRMTTIARSPMFRSIVEEDWLKLPVFRERRKVFRDALRHHKHGDYRASISVLLPHLEGVAFDRFAPGKGGTSPLKAYEYAELDQDMFSDGLLDAITVLYAYIPSFASGPTEKHPLNRHVILHGRTVDYGTQVNSVKVLFAFDHVAQVIRRADEDEAEAKRAPATDTQAS